MTLLLVKTNALFTRGDRRGDRSRNRSPRHGAIVPVIASGKHGTDRLPIHAPFGSFGDLAPKI